MFRIVKYMKNYAGLAAFAVVMLVVQAFCELSLPQYTSAIIDIGIQNHGVGHVLPEKISVQGYETIQLLMDGEEKRDWQSAYEEKEGVYQRKDFTEGVLEKLDKKFAVIWMASAQLSAEMQAQGAVSEKRRKEIRKAADGQAEAMGEAFVHSAAVARTVLAEEAAGVDTAEKQTDYLWRAGAKMLGVSLAMAVAMAAGCFLSVKIGAGVGKDLRERIYKKVMSFSDAEMNRFSTASLITRSTNDVQQIQMVGTMLLRIIAYAPIIGIGGIFKVIQTNSGMEWIIVLAVVLLVAVVLLLLKLAMPKFQKTQDCIDGLNLVSREILTGLSVIRAFGREKREEGRFDDANVALMKNMLFTNRAMSFMMPCMMFIMYGISILIVWTAAGKMETGVIQVGEMTAFITYAMQIVMSFLMLTMLSVIAPRASVAAGRIDEVLSAEISVQDSAGAENISVQDGEVAFHDVSFAYPGGENVIEHISFTAKPGQTTAVIGGTGSGKSTLVNLIPRFYDVTAGEITIDGTDIRKITQKSLRDAIGYVPQKGILFSGTVASNIKYGKEDATQEQIEEAALIAQAKEIVDQKADGYGSPIAQGGSNVSGGQKQRFSIARAIVRNPKIYIFDDSFSALDYKTDAMLRKALAERTGRASVILVAQRISTVLHADQILVLEEGKLVGIGTHQELMKTCSVYRGIAASQLSAEDLEGIGNGWQERPEAAGTAQ